MQFTQPHRAKILIGLLVLLSGLSFTTQATPKPKVIIFDVNETLLDLETMRSSIGAALDGKSELTTLWFSTMLHHSLVTTVTGDYHDFGKIGVAALLMVAQNNGIAITPEEALTAIKTPLLSLPPHPDVKSGLSKLQSLGYKIVSLTNSSNQGVKTQFANAGLTEYFEERLSIEDIKIYKPDLRSYAWAIEKLGIEPQEALMVAAHGWDVAGAKAAGLQTAFIARPGKALYPLAPTPDYIVKDLTELVEILK
ncbi:haloacid dehalogenase type II [Paraglaciecola arctica]|uniref:haloacid dehalogenase type II n=1 Tax=Paraglaciecola arctica TaxID=1128911 RepID=UPI001C06B799|nr:haloacid dehalogenase type II [Paraglaciecola arctica]MBU3004472.1 haloacid dehalogenase type II [Paraglaciecola arctica]